MSPHEKEREGCAHEDGLKDFAVVHLASVSFSPRIVCLTDRFDSFLKPPSLAARGFSFKIMSI